VRPLAGKKIILILIAVNYSAHVCVAQLMEIIYTEQNVRGVINTRRSLNKMKATQSVESKTVTFFNAPCGSIVTAFEYSSLIKAQFRREIFFDFLL